MGYRRIVGLDTDILAVDAARQNIELNQASAGIEISEGSIAAQGGSFDLLAANIISGVLVLLAPEFASHLKPGGAAVLAGILKGQEDEVIEAMEQAGLRLIERYQDGKWISLVAGR